jgi:hypothetical protein
VVGGNGKWHGVHAERLGASTAEESNRRRHIRVTELVRTTVRSASSCAGVLPVCPLRSMSGGAGSDTHAVTV